MKAKKRHVVVIGSGIVGVSAAIWLRRKDVAVTIVDRKPAGDPKATSYGNAGILAACSVAPVTAPGLLRKAPRMALDPNFPLFMRWSYLPKLIPWLVRYMSHANDPDTRRIAEGLAPLTSDSVQQHQLLTKGTKAAQWLEVADYSFAYPNRAAFDADRYTWSLRKIAGFEPELIEGNAVRDFEPALSKDLNLLAVMHDHGFTKDPGAYVADLALEAKKLGAVFRQAEVTDFHFTDDRVTSVVTATGPLKCDNVILASGVWSGPLAKKLGLNVPLESERGYHMVFKSPEGGPSTPLMVTTGKFVATPMADGLRCAGVVEFGGLEAGASKAPLALLERKVRETFPSLTFESSTSWLGHRPAPADSLPLIGEIGSTGVLAGFGHHHIGLTAGPKTGRILAGIITGDRENADINAYDPERF
ncbi:FAD-binding oxidoreductase [Celeribacter halophilus]|jgi:D-amino-acid dehydrogenase|uniref:NAD(P)/FAD-dependent oxidoreductase n=1 Tax=Celeribacter halophilus TaxID=576117 RepID=UPI0026E11EA7|nr:FAD-binding oxidoreductase [Celeribacter halophilus]MDO6723406.1 FAD-binding oxidoreductase [Celeribacter halophilus]